MGDPIREAFQRVKEDIRDLKEGIKKNKNDISSIKEDISSIEENHKNNLESIYNKLGEMFDFQKKEIANLKRQLTLIKDVKKEAEKKAKEKPLYEPDELYKSEEEDSGGQPYLEKGDGKERKKGWFSKVVDFLAEEDE